MPTNEDDLIARMSKLIYTHPTVGAMLGASALRDERTVDIEAAFRVLKERGQTLGENVVWREKPGK